MRRSPERASATRWLGILDLALLGSLLLGPACSGDEGQRVRSAPIAPLAPSPALGAAIAGAAEGGAVLDASVPLGGEPPAGSGVPLDAPQSDVAAESPPPRVSRGSGAPSDLLLAEGDALFAKGDFLAAEKVYRRAAALEPKDPAPVVGALRALLAKERVPVDFGSAPKHKTLAAVVRELGKAIRLDPAYAPAHLELGRALLVQGKAAPALDELRRAVDLAPGDPEAHSALGVALVASGKIEEAIKALGRAAELAPGDAQRHGNLGAALLLAGRTQRAIGSFERAAQLAPRDARVQNDLGTALLSAHDAARAIPFLEAAVAADPRRATYRSNLGYAHHLKGEIDRAMAIYREALTLDPRLASAWINLGNALAQRGRHKEARDAYKKAEDIDPSDPRVKAVLEELDAIERGAVGP